MPSLAQANAAIARHNARVHADWAARGYPNGDPRVEQERRALATKHCRETGEDLQRNISELRQMLDLAKQMDATNDLERKRSLYGKMTGIESRGRQLDHQRGSQQWAEVSAFRQRTGRW